MSRKCRVGARDDAISGTSENPRGNVGMGDRFVAPQAFQYKQYTLDCVITCTECVPPTSLGSERVFAGRRQLDVSTV